MAVDPRAAAAAPHPQQHPQARAAGPARLVDLACFVWDTHNEAAASLDAHVDACLAGGGGGGAGCSSAGASGRTSASASSSGRAAGAPPPAAAGLDADGRTFVSQVAYGLHRYRRLLDAFLAGFFHANSATCR